MDRAPRDRKVLILLIGCTLVWIAGLPFTIPVVAAAAMTASSTGAMDGPWVRIFFWAALTLVPALVICILLSWSAYAVRWPRTAALAALMPLLWLVTLSILILIG
jgi:hypothetical protein